MLNSGKYSNQRLEAKAKSSILAGGKNYLFMGREQCWQRQIALQCENGNTKLAKQEKPKELGSLTEFFGSEAWKN